MPDPINLGDASRLSVPEQVLTRRAAGETVILDLRSQRYFGLEGVSHRLWEMIEAGTTVDKATQALLSEYDVDETLLRADLEAVIADLHGRGLVQVDAP